VNILQAPIVLTFCKHSSFSPERKKTSYYFIQVGSSRPAYVWYVVEKQLFLCMWFSALRSIYHVLLYRQ
jgi:hypothetical protein